MPVTAVRRVGRAVVLVQVHTTVSLEEWTERLEEMFKHDQHPEVDVLVGWSDGQLNAQQRQMTAAMQARLRATGRDAPPALVFTDSKLSRGVITAMRWVIDLKARAFPKAALLDTLQAEGFSPQQAHDIEQSIVAMERQLLASDVRS